MNGNFKQTFSKIFKPATIIAIGTLTVVTFIFFSDTISKYFLSALVYSGTGAAKENHQYAYSENAGWLNFRADEGRFKIESSQLTGYIWAENIGWISLSCANDSSCSSVDYGILNDGEGNLSGYAWSENTGWINFNPTGGGVSVSDSGTFSGHAWGENLGWISFNCLDDDSCEDVSYRLATDWAFAQAGGGGLPSQAYEMPSSPEYGNISLSINKGSPAVNKREVVLTFNVGTNVKRMAISNTIDFQNAVQEEYASEKQWLLAQGDGVKNVYAKFFTEYGQPSSVVSSSIILKTSIPEIKILADQKKEYGSDEEIIIRGNTDPDSQISFFLDDRYGRFNSDYNGEWLATLGKLAPGKHKITMTPKDIAGNTGKAVSVSFSVKEKVIPKIADKVEPSKEAPSKPPIKQQITDSNGKPPQQITKNTVSVNPPKALSGKWKLLLVFPQAKN